MKRIALISINKSLLLLLVFFLFAFSACKKENKKRTCYECDASEFPTGTYQQVGCYTELEWKSFDLTDPSGVSLDKKQRCRER